MIVIQEERAMFRHFFLLCISLLVFLTSCISTNYEVTPTAIPTFLPTATKMPEPITGVVFWDANGSGLKDETSFIVPAYEAVDLPYFFDLLAANGTNTSAFVEGELATVPEPPIPGIKVCLDNNCTETNADGSFIIQPTKAQDTYYLKLIDPNSDDPTMAFRYINEWNGPIAIESYEINEVIVPEQHLNLTNTTNITTQLAVESNQIEIGLMQGFLTAPYFCEDWQQIVNIHGFDHDINQGSVRDFTGNTLKISELLKPGGVGDQHTGWDYGTDLGDYVISTSPGYTSNWETDDGGTHVRIDHPDMVEFNHDHIVTTYGHLLKVLERGKTEPRGKIIGETGETGATDWVHLHLGVCINSEPFFCRDPYGILYSDTETTILDSEENLYSNIELDAYLRNSLWTVYNIPNCLDDTSKVD